MKADRSLRYLTWGPFSLAYLTNISTRVVMVFSVMVSRMATLLFSRMPTKHSWMQDWLIWYECSIILSTHLEI